ncbi:hypothetical protein DSAG12_04185 [Promethearchaeum syntrophicum]|uniref:Uncharacterized protein n=1 Tax=Promethearchaeum syntrophicum TaxID=2594042 RepID=A0AC61ZTY5_9ARCH
MICTRVKRILKTIQKPYSIDVLENDPNHVSKLETKSLLKKIRSLTTAVISYAKISNRLSNIKVNLNSDDPFYDRYSRIIRSLNHIYHYNPDLATRLAYLCFNSQDIDINEQSLIDSNVDHWIVHSEEYMSLKYPNIEISKEPWIFNFATDSNIKKEIDSILTDAQEISGYSLYLSSIMSQSNTLVTGIHMNPLFLHIMDAALHANIPGAFEDNCIFMSYNRLRALIDPTQEVVLTVQENDFIEYILKKIIKLQGRATFQENLKSFNDLIFDKTISENALWTNGNRKGFIWKLTSGTELSPFLDLRKKYLDGDTSVMEWNFVSVEEAQIFIGSLAGNLQVTFPQLGITGVDSIFTGDSEGELKHQLAFQFYKSGDNFIRIKPGEPIRNANGDIIGAPRFLMVKNQFVIALSHDTFNVDTVIHFNDLRNTWGDTFKDKGRNFIVGYHGVHKEGYSDTKIRKIKEAQDKGAAFISGIEDSVVWSNFMKSIEVFHAKERSGDEHFESVFLMADILDKLVHIVNNPADYDLGFEDIINEITEKAYSPEYFDYHDDYKGLTLEECQKVAEAFGKYVDAGVVKTLPGFVKWWNNFKNSNQYIVHKTGSWYLDQARIIASRFWLIKKFYNEMDPTHTPDWVVHLPLSMPWGNL